MKKERELEMRGESSKGYEEKSGRDKIAKNKNKKKKNNNNNHSHINHISISTIKITPT